MPDLKTEIANIISQRAAQQKGGTTPERDIPVASPGGPTEAEINSVDTDEVDGDDVELGIEDGDDAEEAAEGIENPTSETDGSDGGNSTDTDPPEKPTEPAPEKDAANEGDQKPPPPKSWSAMFRKERQVRERESALQARMGEIEAREAKAREVLDALEKDPYAFVEQRGFNYDKWAQRRLAGGAPEPMDEVAKLRQQLEQMQAGQAEAQKKAQEEMQRQQHLARANAWVEGVPAVLKDPKYSIIADWGAQDDVAKVATLALQKTGRWLTQTEAADLIVKEIESTVDRLEKAGRIQRNRPKPPAAQSPEATGPAQTKPIRTAAKRKRPLTERERIQLAAKRLRLT